MAKAQGVEWWSGLVVLTVPEADRKGRRGQPKAMPAVKVSEKGAMTFNGYAAKEYGIREGEKIRVAAAKKGLPLEGWKGKPAIVFFREGHEVKEGTSFELAKRGRAYEEGDLKGLSALGFKSLRFVEEYVKGFGKSPRGIVKTSALLPLTQDRDALIADASDLEWK